MRRRFNEEQDLEIKSLYDGGMTLLQLAEKYQASTAAVRGALTRTNAAVRSLRETRATPLSAEQEDELVQRYLAGERTQALSKEFCIGHKRLYALVEQQGHTARRGPVAGPDHPWWKGGRTVANGVGYVSVWIPVDHPYAVMRNHKGRVMEHRLVMAESLGRPLAPGETVHHVNGIKYDNRIENLQLHVSGHGPGQLYRCQSCGSFHVVAVPLERRTSNGQ